MTFSIRTRWPSDSIDTIAFAPGLSRSFITGDPVLQFRLEAEWKPNGEEEPEVD